MLLEYIPKDLIQNSITLEDKWKNLIKEAFLRNKYVTERAPRIAAKEDIVIFAQLNWPMMFSRFFESVQSSGPQLSTKNVIIGINWTGMFFISEQEEILVIFYIEQVH